MINNEMVSIITPAYNCENYISKAIESVQAQTYTNWEMIIANDNSQDGTQDIIENYIKNDRRIKLINLKNNSGVVTARNTAINVAKGRYIAFLDADDCWKRDKLTKQLDYMESHEYAFTYTNYEYMDETGKNVLKKVKIPPKQDYKQGLKNTAIGCLTVIIDRKIVGNFQMPYLKHGEDHFTWLEIMKRGHCAYGLDESLAYYRISDNSLTANKFKVINYQWSNYRKYEKISLIPCIYYFLCYLFNAIRKHYV